MPIAGNVGGSDYGYLKDPNDPDDDDDDFGESVVLTNIIMQLQNWVVHKIILIR